MKSVLFGFCLLVFSSSFVVAQQNYTWDEYGLSFMLADDFAEEVNNIEEFSAAGDGMYFSIFPFKDETVTESDITDYTISIAESLQLQEIDDVDVIKLNYFKGGYVEGYKDGLKVFLMGLIDPNSDTNFFVLITFLDQDNVAIDEAVRMVKNIKKI
ncbi:MAG: hypothetical protein IPM42_07520 [Saprospiraceae bacterium]|nr:hypothetical protein [Saprospiraceae bacterium]